MTDIKTLAEQCRGDLAGAARLLGITRPQLAYRLKRNQNGCAEKTDKTDKDCTDTEAGA